jgi:hypothetical protein
VQSKIISSAGNRPNKAASRIAQGSRVSKSSKIGELSFGFVSQKFSGGGTTQQLWGGYEFGSNKYKQFPIWSGRGPWISLDILSIQPCVPNSHISLLNGKMLLLRF